MRTYKPADATHYADGLNGGTIWYRRVAKDTWLFWWSTKNKWSHSTHDDKSAAIALRAVVSDTGANQ
jgi:hypothetical protein